MIIPALIHRANSFILALVFTESIDQASGMSTPLASSQHLDRRPKPGIMLGV